MELYMRGPVIHTFITSIIRYLGGWVGGKGVHECRTIQRWHCRIINVDLNWKIWFTKFTVHRGCHTIGGVLKK